MEEKTNDQLAQAWHQDTRHVKYLDAIEYSVWERIPVTIEVPENQTIVFGHTPTSRYRGNDLPLKIWHRKGLIGIDCGCAFAAFGGQLGCICLDTLEEFYSDIDQEKEDEQSEEGTVCTSD